MQFDFGIKVGRWVMFMFCEMNWFDFEDCDDSKILKQNGRQNLDVNLKLNPSG